MEVEILESNRGKEKIAHLDYLYTVEKFMKTNIRWRCVERYHKCRAVLVTDLDKQQPQLRSPHNHQSNKAKVDCLRSKIKMKKMVKEGVKNVALIYAAGVSELDGNAKALLPSKEGCKRMIRYQREVSRGKKAGTSALGHQEWMTPVLGEGSFGDFSLDFLPVAVKQEPMDPESSEENISADQNSAFFNKSTEMSLPEVPVGSSSETNQQVFITGLQDSSFIDGFRSNTESVSPIPSPSSPEEQLHEEGSCKCSCKTYQLMMQEHHKFVREILQEERERQETRVKMILDLEMRLRKDYEKFQLSILDKMGRRFSEIMTTMEAKNIARNYL